METRQLDNYEDQPRVQKRDGYPTPHETAALAYSYWEARGCPPGDPDEDWFRAEAQLLDARQRD